MTRALPLAPAITPLAAAAGVPTSPLASVPSQAPPLAQPALDATAAPREGLGVSGCTLPAAAAGSTSTVASTSTGTAQVPPGRQGWQALLAIRQAIPPRAYWALALAGLALPLLAWIAVVSSGSVDAVFLPGPAAVMARMATWWADGLAGDIGTSVMRVVAGWALAAVIAVPLGLLIGTWRAVQGLLEPLMDFIRYMPAVAFVPLVMVWVGIDEGAKVAVIFIGTFFPMVLMVAEDVRRVPMAQIEAAQTMGARCIEILEQVIVPSAKPALLDTLRVNMGCAWTYLVVAELVAANSGLGYAILKAQRFLQTDKIFAGILVIGLIGLVTDQLFRLAHRKAFPWLHGGH